MENLSLILASGYANAIAFKSRRWPLGRQGRSPPHIPNELQNLIARELFHDSSRPDERVLFKTLASLRLTSHSWSRAATPWMFNEILISPRSIDSMRAFESISQAYPLLVQRLRIPYSCQAEAEEPIGEEEEEIYRSILQCSISAFVNLESIHLGACRNSIHTHADSFHIWIRVLSMQVLPKLKELRVGSVDTIFTLDDYIWATLNQTPSGTFRRPIPIETNLKNLTTVHLSSIEHDPAFGQFGLEWTAFADALPETLEQLMISDSSFKVEPSFEAPPLLSEIHVKQLSLINVQLGVPMLLELLSSTKTTLQSLRISDVSVDIADGTWQEAFRLLTNSSTQLTEIAFVTPKPAGRAHKPSDRLAVSYEPALATSEQYSGSIYSSQQHREIMREPWYQLMRPYDIRTLIDLYSSIDFRLLSQGREPRYTDERHRLQRCFEIPRAKFDWMLRVEAFFSSFAVITVLYLFVWIANKWDEMVAQLESSHPHPQ